MQLKTNKICTVARVVESRRMPNSYKQTHLANTDLTRRNAFVIGRPFSAIGKKVPAGTVYYKDVDEAYKEFNKLLDK